MTSNLFDELWSWPYSAELAALAFGLLYASIALSLPWRPPAGMVLWRYLTPEAYADAAEGLAVGQIRLRAHRHWLPFIVSRRPALRPRRINFFPEQPSPFKLRFNLGRRRCQGELVEIRLRLEDLQAAVPSIRWYRRRIDGAVTAVGFGDGYVGPALFVGPRRVDDERLVAVGADHDVTT